MNLRAWKLIYQKWFLGTPQGPPYKHVVQIGDPVLRQVAKPVDPAEIRSYFMLRLYERLRQLMRQTQAEGLAAPQIGVSLRVFAIQFPEKKHYPRPEVYQKKGMHHIPFQIWVNPEMKVLEYTKLTGEECCQSMLGFSADIPRYIAVQLTGLDPDGSRKEWTARDWSARIVQHEMDHLDGKFFTDSMLPKSLAMTNWTAVNYHQGRIYTTYMPKR